MELQFEIPNVLSINNGGRPQEVGPNLYIIVSLSQASDLKIILQIEDFERAATSPITK